MVTRLCRNDLTQLGGYDVHAATESPGWQFASGDKTVGRGAADPQQYGGTRNRKQQGHVIKRVYGQRYSPPYGSKAVSASMGILCWLARPL